MTHIKQLQRDFYALAAFVLLCAVALLNTGCAGTQAAYKAANGEPDKVAFVIMEHYDALLQEANAFKSTAQTPEAQTLVARIQAADRDAAPAIDQLRGLAQAYTAVKNATTQAELQAGIDQAAIALSRLIEAVKQTRSLNGGTS